MHEAIDYNALGWVRKELGEALNQARIQLEEYAADTVNDSALQQCAAQLHEALGPLKMVDIKGAVLLVSEMEEIVADLLHGNIQHPDNALQQLMEAFLQLPDYLTSIRSGRQDRPEALLPLINSLRETRGEKPLQQSAVFSPNLSARVPSSVFDVRAKPSGQDVQAMARAARTRFQAGLLEWYRDSESDSGMQSLANTLEGLRSCAGSEPVARIWWVGSGVVAALRDGSLNVTVDAKQMFGQLDRQIKRLVDAGEYVFDDVLSDELMRNLLFHIALAKPVSPVVSEIRDTYGVKQMSADGESPVQDSGLLGCNDEMMQAVAITLRADMGRIKELVDTMQEGDCESSQLDSVMNEFHALSNTLAMIGLDESADVVVDWENRLREFIKSGSVPNEPDFILLADALMSVENAIVDVAEGNRENSVLINGIDAVTREVVANMATVKEMLSEYMQSDGGSDLLVEVTALLAQISGSLMLSGQERAAAAAGQINRFVTSELIESGRKMDDEQTDALADAICSIEIFVEEIAENRSNTGSALEIAESCLDKLGYPCPPVDYADSQSGFVELEIHDNYIEQPLESVDVICASDNGDVTDEITAATVQSSEDEQSVIISGMQVIAADADEEILEIFIEEAEEELLKISAFMPIWVASPEVNEYLTDIRRSCHTLKGSGRMVGAMAMGEFAWVLECLINKVIEGAVKPHARMQQLMTDAVYALQQLLCQVKGESFDSGIEIDNLAQLIVMCGDPEAVFTDEVEAGVETACTSDELTEVVEQETEQVEADLQLDDATNMATGVNESLSDQFPALSDGADEEIIEIFIEEAAEEVASVTEMMQLLLDQPDNDDVRVSIRRSLHTLKGSGRMAGAMAMGEFAWAMEDLLNKVIEGTINLGDDIKGLMAVLPEALSQLLVQIQGGSEPVIDLVGMMRCAEVLGRGESASFAVAEVINDAETVDQDDDGDVSLIEIFTIECNEHLQSIFAYLSESGAPREVSEPLYRALHTISGISESAGISSIRRIAGALNDYVDAHFHAGQAIDQDAIDLIGIGATEITAAVERLPDVAFDEDYQARLCEQIYALPSVVEETEMTEPEQPASDFQVEEVGILPSEETENIVAAEESHEQSPDPVSVAEVNDDFSEMDQELYEIFVEEVTEIIDSSESVLRDWSEEPDNREHMAEFQRQLHTIKGGARMMDILAIGDLSHVLESLMTRVAEGLTETSDDLFSLMQESHDQLSEMLEQVKSRQMPAAATSLIVRIESLCGIESDATMVEEQVEQAECVEASVATSPEEDVANGQESDSCSDADVVVDADTPVMEDLVHTGNENISLPRKYVRKEQTHVKGEQVRVQSNVLEDMVNYAGEINIYRSRMEQQVTDYRFNLAELDQTIARLRGQLRQLEMETEAQILYRFEQESDDANQDFDPLEMDRYSTLQQLSRSLIESISDLQSLQELMGVTTRESETLLLQQSRVNTDLQEGLMRTRMIPFAGLSSRLRRIVRQSARQLGKKVELDLVGADGEMDRTVIDRIIAPLEHMLRNSIAHGIEVPKERKAAGKKENGLITIAFDREGSEIVLRIEDDGAGINASAVRKRAIERGLMLADSKLSDHDITQFILQTGFSTATEVTQISGRGVGMDVVNSEVKQLGGTLHIESKAGIGTVFTIRLPYTLAINQALVTVAGSESFCVPLGSVEGVVRVNNDELASCYHTDESVYHYAGNEYQLKHLGTLLNTGVVGLGAEKEQAPVLLIRVGEKRIALHVEALLGSREIVIKPVGLQFSTVDCISGATIMGDGSVVMILDMAAISRMNVRADLPEQSLASEQESRLVVMVVDDSITVRKVTSRLLERNGYKVLTAKDGVDALGQLQDSVPDMMLLDIEMPRMDGFELATHMRNDDGLKHVPIIMITSRTGEKHRARAEQIGVNNYLGKPYQENDLLESIQQIIGVSAVGAVA